MLGSIPINLPNHCIDPNGFNKGRDNLTKAFIAAAKAKNSGFTTSTQSAQVCNCSFQLSGKFPDLSFLGLRFFDVYGLLFHHQTLTLLPSYHTNEEGSPSGVDVCLSEPVAHYVCDGEP